MSDTRICQPRAASQIDVAYSIALLDKLNYGGVGQMLTMSEMDVVKVFGQSADSLDCLIGDISTFCENQIPQSWRSRYYHLDSIIPDSVTGCQIQYAQSIEFEVVFEIGEGMTVNANALC